MGTNPFGYLKNKLYRSHCSLIFVDGRSGRADLLGTSSFGAGISAIILGGLAFLPRAMGWFGPCQCLSLGLRADRCTFRPAS